MIGLAEQALNQISFFFSTFCTNPNAAICTELIKITFDVIFLRVLRNSGEFMV